MIILDPTEEEKYKGYQLCSCGHGVHLLTAGFDVEMTMCGQCMREVADVDEFNCIKEDMDYAKKRN
mgnify:CR=1 FL=1